MWELGFAGFVYGISTQICDTIYSVNDVCVFRVSLNTNAWFYATVTMCVGFAAYRTRLDIYKYIIHTIYIYLGLVYSIFSYASKKSLHVLLVAYVRI